MRLTAALAKNGFCGLVNQSANTRRGSSFAVGGEFRLSKPLRLRLGYNNQVRRDIAFGASKGLGGLSAGLGILIKDYRIDYAFNGLARLGALHRVTINATF